MEKIIISLGSESSDSEQPEETECAPSDTERGEPDEAATGESIEDQMEKSESEFFDNMEKYQQIPFGSEEFEETNITMHPSDECRIYMNIDEPFRRYKYEVCRPTVKGCCDTCNTSYSSFSKLTQTNCLANELSESKGKAPLNYLLFPVCRQQKNKPQPNKSYHLNAENVTTKGPPQSQIATVESCQSYELNYRDTTDKPMSPVMKNVIRTLYEGGKLRKEEHYALFEYALLGLYKELNISEGVDSSVEDDEQKCVLDEEIGDGRKEQPETNKVASVTVDKTVAFTDEIVEATARDDEQVVTTDDEETVQAPKPKKLRNRKNKKKKPPTMAPMKVTFPARTYVELRARPIDPMFEVMFGHITICIYSQDELQNVNFYYEEFLKRLLPSPLAAIKEPPKEQEQENDPHNKIGTLVHLPPRRILILPEKYYKVRILTGVEPLCVVEFGHIRICIYNKDELRNIYSYFKKYEKILFPVTNADQEEYPK